MRSPRALDLHTLLRGFCWARLAAAGVVLTVGPWAPAILLPTASGRLLFAVSLLVVVPSGLLLAGARPPRPRVLAWLVCLLDAALITAVVAATGGARSVLVSLYVLLVTAASVLLSRWGAVAIALLASGLYAVVVLARAILPAAAFDIPVDRAAALDALAVLVTSGTLTIVSLVAGGLADRFLQSERELERERRRLGDLRAFSDVIFHSVGAGLVALDRSDRITAFNPAAERMTGVPASTAIGASWTDVFGPGRPLAAVDLAPLDEPTTSVRNEITLSRADGATVTIRTTASALEAGDGARLGSVVVCEDLSSLRALETGLRQADRLATLGRMAANLAHEVRNPLAALSGAVETLTQAGVAAEAQGRLAEIVVRESGRLSEVIGHFLEYARPAPLVLERVDAAIVMEGVLASLSARGAAAGVKMLRAWPPALPLEADRERLRQAVWTLCVNALAAMPAGGELRMEGQRRAGVVEITVADTGAGISSESLAHAFEPFFASRRDATGLGYALAHRIVEEHGGRLTVRSEGGLGAEFTARLPARHA